MKRIIPLLILAFVIAGCQHDGPIVPVDGPQFAKPTCPGHPSCKDDDGGKDEVQYAFKYPASQGDLGSDCWGPRWADVDGDGQEDETAFDCAAREGQTFALQVEDAANGAVQYGGTVEFEYCMLNGSALSVRWCCCLYPRSHWNPLDCRVSKTVGPDADGRFVFALPLIPDGSETRSGIHSVGLRWRYDADGKGQPETRSDWYDFIVVP